MSYLQYSNLTTIYILNYFPYFIKYVEPNEFPLSLISKETLLKIRYRATLISSSQNLLDLQIYPAEYLSWIHLYVIYILMNYIVLSDTKK